MCGIQLSCNPFDGGNARVCVCVCQLVRLVGTLMPDSYVMLPLFYFTIGTGIAAFLLWIVNDATAPRL